MCGGVYPNGCTDSHINIIIRRFSDGGDNRGDDISISASVSTTTSTGISAAAAAKATVAVAPSTAPTVISAEGGTASAVAVAQKR